MKVLSRGIIDPACVMKSVLLQCGGGIKGAWKQGEQLGDRCHKLMVAQPWKACAMWQGACVPGVCLGRKEDSVVWGLFLFPSLS